MRRSDWSLFVLAGIAAGVLVGLMLAGKVQLP